VTLATPDFRKQKLWITSGLLLEACASTLKLVALIIVFGHLISKLVTGLIDGSAAHKHRLQTDEQTKKPKKQYIRHLLFSLDEK